MLLFPAVGRAQAQKEPYPNRTSNRTLNRIANRSGTVDRPPALSARSAVLMDAATGRILYEENAEEKSLIASTTKIMTGLLVCEAGELDAVVAVPTEAVGIEGSSMYLQAGETLTRRELLYGLMLCSGNDAAVAIAQGIGGSVKGFVRKMNDTAKELGMTSSSFANPNGLDDENHYSTARDMAVLARAAMENETLVRIASTRSITIGGRTMQNHNKLLGLVPGCLGLKTGYTRAAGRTLVSCAERKGQRLIAVTLQDGNDWADHQSLYDYGFSQYPAKEYAIRGKVLTQSAVAGGISPQVPLIAGESFSWPTADGENVTTEICLDTPLTAPVAAGKTVGRAVFRLNGAEIGTVPLLTGRAVLPKLTAAMSQLKLELEAE